MNVADFPLLFAIGSLGGLACSLLVAAALAVFALRRRLGTPRQLALGSLICLLATALMLAPNWWLQNRLGTVGPALTTTEVGFWLGWTSLLGWVVPLGTLAAYLVLAVPQVLAESQQGPRRTGGPVEGILALDDPLRLIEPLGAGRAWGQLVPLADGEAAGRPLPLTLAVTLLGREIDNDIVLDDDRVSRHHAEFRWNAGHPQLLDRGSLNGTRHNSQAARGLLPLGTGDLIEIGSRRYRFEQRAIPRITPLEETHKLPSVRRESLPPFGTQAESFFLVATNGPWLGTRWTVDSPLVTIGRDTQCDICLAHGSISRRHAQLVRQASGYFLSDLDSANGTLVNGQPALEPLLLRAGDVVRVGEIELVCAAMDALLAYGSLRSKRPPARSAVPTMPPPTVAR